jgi:death-on-curing protein
VTDPREGTDYLSLEDLLEIADGVIEDLRVRDLGLLASAAARPQATAFGADAYPSFAEKAAALMHSVARNHALVDGNKRLAWAATRVFCLLNNTDLAFTVDDAEATVLAVASGDVEVPELAVILDQHLIGRAND